jgi:hypothetical protein
VPLVILVRIRVSSGSGHDVVIYVFDWPWHEVELTALEALWVHSLHAECEHPRLGPKAHLPAHLVVKRRSRVLIAGRACD